MSHRLTKKQLRQDQFLQSIYVALEYLRENPVVTGAGLLGLVALLVVAVRVGGSATGIDRDANSPAEQALATARTEFTQGRFEAGQAALEDVRTRHSGSRAAREATFLYANTLFESGDYAGAQQAYEDFLTKPIHADLLEDSARYGIGACKEELGNYPAASTDYLALWNSAGSPGTRLMAGLSAARVARLQGRDDEARELYEKIVHAFPNAPESEDAKYALMELDAG